MAILNMNAHAYRKYISESAKPVLVEFRLHGAATAAASNRHWS